ncbi:hypothetical protein AGMMS49975_08830 [Clostridia bacterium]|nr:hypothetical protein AGMMS49975_08830 [Clostridia bacterium]
MIIIEKNEGQKVQYEQNGYTVSFAEGELSLNCAIYQRDWAAHLYICANDYGQLVIGTESGKTYVAEIDIPARSYIYPDAPVENPVAEDEDEDTEDNGGNIAEQPAPTPVPLSMDDVTLSLWAIA